MPGKSTHKKKARRKATPRFYLTIGAGIVFLAVVAVLVTRGPKQIALAEGYIDYSRGAEVTLVRDEELYLVDDYLKVDFFVAEGQSVAKGTKIAEIYKTSINEQTITDLSTLQQNIKEYQENTALKGVINNDITEKNKQIGNRMQEISDVITGKSNADLVSLERKLNELMQQKSELLKQYSTTNYDELNDMYDREEDIKNRIAQGTTSVPAPEAGTVSFNLDGLETVLIPEALDALTKEDFENAKKGIQQDKPNPEGKTPLYRLVNNFKWYCVIYTEPENEIAQLREGESFQLAFESMGDKPYEARVIKVRAMEDGGKIYTLEVNQDIGPMISVRYAKASVKKRYQGIRVPLEGIYEQDGKKLIKLISTNNSVQPVEIDVLMQDDKNAIIQSKNPELTISAGQNVILR